MLDQYATIAQKYKKAKLHPWRVHIEEFTLFHLLGDLTGLSVLDMACGEGHYTRKLKQRGAEHVVGVDLSESMIELAREQEVRQPLGVKYVCLDAAEFTPVEPFDVVAAAYLLNYARTPAQLFDMARAVSRSLKPGGRFVSVNDNVWQPASAFRSAAQYGIVKELDGDLVEGAAIHYTLALNGQSVRFDNYYLSPKTYERVLREAGLGVVRWHEPRLSPAGEAEFGRDYWQAFLGQPPVIFLECVRRP